MLHQARRSRFMPIHEYKCRKCEEVVERIEGIHDEPMKKCPSCSGKVDRLMSVGAFHLKGSGWYATDYGNKGKKAASCPSASGGDAPAACAGCPKID
jgi:putative FmdB family regulatory protein